MHTPDLLLCCIMPDTYVHGGTTAMYSYGDYCSSRPWKVCVCLGIQVECLPERCCSSFIVAPSTLLWPSMKKGSNALSSTAGPVRTYIPGTYNTYVCVQRTRRSTYGTWSVVDDVVYEHDCTAVSVMLFCCTRWSSLLVGIIPADHRRTCTAA